MEREGGQFLFRPGHGVREGVEPTTEVGGDSAPLLGKTITTTTDRVYQSGDFEGLCHEILVTLYCQPASQGSPKARPRAIELECKVSPSFYRHQV